MPSGVSSYPVLTLLQILAYIAEPIALVLFMCYLCNHKTKFNSDCTVSQTYTDSGFEPHPHRLKALQGNN